MQGGELNGEKRYMHIHTHIYTGDARRWLNSPRVEREFAFIFFHLDDPPTC